MHTFHFDIQILREKPLLSYIMIHETARVKSSLQNIVICCDLIR